MMRLIFKSIVCYLRCESQRPSEMMSNMIELYKLEGKSIFDQMFGGTD